METTTDQTRLLNNTQMNQCNIFLFTWQLILGTILLFNLILFMNLLEITQCNKVTAVGLTRVGVTSIKK